MHIRRYDCEFTRRQFLRGVGGGMLTTGVLAPLANVLASDGDATRAYPDELRSIEDYTRGKLKAGDIIDANNVEHVKTLLEPVRYQQVATMGRRLRLAPTTNDLMRLSPWEYIEATHRHRGQARFDSDGNVVTLDGKPWIGGNPFPSPTSALEVFAGLTLSWGRHDSSLYASREYDIDAAGEMQFQYESGWAEYAPVGRIVLDPRPSVPGQEDKLRFQSAFFTGPESVRGTSFLNVWHYDQNKFPDLYGYLPAFKRVRRFPTDQRFEPLVPGSSLYLSDAWAAGDPLHTWGNYKIVGRGPALAAVSGGWNADHPNWQHTTHGGPKGLTFWDTTVELVPEAIVIEAEPVRFPRAPISKKRVWFDARTLLPIAMVSYDRRGEVYRSFDGAFSLYERDGQSFADGAHPYWSWTHLHAHDTQTGRMTRIEQVKAIAGGHSSRANDPAIYDRYLTQQALQRLGSG